MLLTSPPSYIIEASEVNRFRLFRWPSSHPLILSSPDTVLLMARAKPTKRPKPYTDGPPVTTLRTMRCRVPPPSTISPDISSDSSSHLGDLEEEDSSHLDDRDERSQERLSDHPNDGSDDHRSEHSSIYEKVPPENLRWVFNGEFCLVLHDVDGCDKCEDFGFHFGNAKLRLHQTFHEARKLYEEAVRRDVQSRVDRLRVRRDKVVAQVAALRRDVVKAREMSEKGRDGGYQGTVGDDGNPPYGKKVSIVSAPTPPLSPSASDDGVWIISPPAS